MEDEKKKNIQLDGGIDRVQNVIDRLNSCNDVKEAEAVINQILPGWLVMSTNEYSHDYDYLDRNWKALCNRMNTVPQKIILVRDYDLESENTMKINISEFLTKNGYCIRRVGELQFCQVCRKALLSYELWRIVKEKGMNVPPTWSPNCIGCE